MDDRTKALIAVGASVAANCEPCATYHIGKAREAGADDKEVTSAVEVARSVLAGAMKNMDSFLARAVTMHETAAGAATKGCGCGC